MGNEWAWKAVIGDSWNRILFLYILYKHSGHLRTGVRWRVCSAVMRTGVFRRKTFSIGTNWSISISVSYRVSTKGGFKSPKCRGKSSLIP